MKARIVENLKKKKFNSVFVVFFLSSSSFRIICCMWCVVHVRINTVCHLVESACLLISRRPFLSISLIASLFLVALSVLTIFYHLAHNHFLGEKKHIMHLIVVTTMLWQHLCNTSIVLIQIVSHNFGNIRA